MAIKNKDDVIVMCEDDHCFTQDYSNEYLFYNIVEAHKQGAEMLSGGIGGFGIAVPVDKIRYWVDWLWCLQFIVIYKSFFQKILDYQFKETDTTDGAFSFLTYNKMTIFPCISIQKEFGYSDVTTLNNRFGQITEHFNHANRRLSQIHEINSHFNYKS